MANKTYKVLLIEDNKIDQLVFERFVKNEKLNYEYTITASVSEARSMLGCKQFDIIVSDYSLEDGTALDILHSVDNTPVILTTGAADEAVAIKAWEAGASGYLPKDHERNYLKALPRAIENAIKRKELEQALDRKQKNLEAIFDATPIGMMLIDDHMVVTRVNHAIKRLVNREYSQIIDRGIGDALGCINCKRERRECGHGRACQSCLLMQTVKMVLDMGKPIHDIETHLALKISDGAVTIWLQISAEPVVINGHRYVILAVNDITERKKIEDQRLLVEEKYRVIFDNSPAAIMVADAKEQLVSWNKFTEALLDCDKEHLHLRQVKSLYPPGEWERMRACRVRAKKMQPHFETSMVKKDGSIIEVDVSISILDNLEGKIAGTIGVVRDITERKRAEEELRETMELKSQFISTVSHELRTPLTAIKEGLGIVLDEVVGRINGTQRKFLDIAKRNADRLNDLLGDVLDFQKFEAGSMKLDLQNNNIEEVLSEAYETMAFYAKSKGVELSFIPTEKLPEAQFDRAKIIQVLTNLLSNAIKFTPEQGKVSVGVRHQDEDWIISVSDTGMGIPKEALPKIFERFYRVPRPGKQIQGTGLGLAIVHKIVTLHGGRIEVQSEVDQGTTFEVFMPLNAKPASENSSMREDHVAYAKCDSPS